MAPVVDRLTEEYKGDVEIRALNVEDDEEAARMASGFRVQYVPTFVLVDADGTAVNTLGGELDEGDLRDALDAIK
jgi:thioredoxin-like negative regulator of GroEL